MEYYESLRGVGIISFVLNGFILPLIKTFFTEKIVKLRYGKEISLKGVDF